MELTFNAYSQASNIANCAATRFQFAQIPSVNPFAVVLALAFAKNSCYGCLRVQSGWLAATTDFGSAIVAAYCTFLSKKI